MLGGAWGETSQLNPKFPSQEYSAIVTQNPWLGLSVGKWSLKDPSQPKGPWTSLKANGSGSSLAQLRV